jgi:hypothetical protein
VFGSTEGSTFDTLVPSADYLLDPATGDTVTIKLPPGTQERALELSVTGNTGWQAAQISEFEIYS